MSMCRRDGKTTAVRAAVAGAILSLGWSVGLADRAQAQVEIPPGWEIVTVADGAEFRHDRPDINDRGDIVFTRWGNPADHSTREIFM